MNELPDDFATRKVEQQHTARADHESLSVGSVGEAGRVLLECGTLLCVMTFGTFVREFSTFWSMPVPAWQT